MAKTTKAALRLTDCDVIVAAILAPASTAPPNPPGENNDAYQARALTAFKGLLEEIAMRGGTAAMRREAVRAALQKDTSGPHLAGSRLKAK